MSPRLEVFGRRMREIARALRHAPDRVLHPLRRMRSTAAVKELGGVRLVLVVCLGNICRSPYAAAALRRLTGSGIRIESAGFIGPGRSVPETGRRVAQRRGLNLEDHRSQLVTAELVSTAELIIVMDRSQARELWRRFGRSGGVLVLGDLDPFPIDMRTVRDPFDQAEIVFEMVYERIDRCVAGLGRALAGDDDVVGARTFARARMEL